MMSATRIIERGKALEHDLEETLQAVCQGLITAEEGRVAMCDLKFRMELVKAMSQTLHVHNLEQAGAAA